MGKDCKSWRRRGRGSSVVRGGGGVSWEKRKRREEG